MMVWSMLFLAIVALCGFLYFSRPEKVPSETPVVPALVSEGEAPGPMVGSDKVSVGAVPTVAPVSMNSLQYRDPKGRFSFSYSAGFKVATLSDGEGGEMVTVQNSKDTKEGLQIRVVQADEDIDITPERIRADIPDIVVDNPQSVTLDGKGKGTMFESDDPSFDGQSREVWFSYKRTVYQVSTYLKYDSLVKEVLGTWKF